MNEDTPLEEVAHHLSTPVAQILDEEHSTLQIGTLASVKNAVIYLEEAGVELDPIDYSHVLDAITICALNLLKGVEQQGQTIAKLKHKARRADILLRELLEEGERDD